jgi:hypothetical protein
MPVIELQRELNRAMSQLSHILALSGNPIAVLENVDTDTDIAVKPGAIWNIPEKARAYLVDLLKDGGLQLHIAYIELLLRMLHDISETPREAFGGMDRALSGVAMQIELYPLVQKIMRKRAIRTTAYNRRNWMILELIARFGNKTKGKIAEIDGGKREIKEISPDDFRLKVVWGQILPQDMEKLVYNEQILVQNGIHSRRRAMDEVGVKDPEAEFMHWKEEQAQILEINTNTQQVKS